MKQVAVISGKGGTGKTSVVSALARLARPLVTADCDVDAANLAILMTGLDGAHMPFYTGERATIDLRKCTRCGTCARTCRFDAVRQQEGGLPWLDPFVCEGCGACVLACEAGALDLFSNIAGVWTVRPTGCGPLVHAMLGVAQDNSGTLVTQVREQARETAEAEGLDLVLIDGPPGIGKPVQATVEGTDLVVVVTEPSSSGLHDLGRVLDLAARSGVPAAVIINKADLDDDNRAAVEAECRRAGAAVAGRLPFDAAVPRALARGELPLSVPGVADELARIWQILRKTLTADR